MLGDSGSKVQNIKYVAVARSSDQVTVASFMPEKGDHNSDQVKALFLFQAPKPFVQFC